MVDLRSPELHALAQADLKHGLSTPDLEIYDLGLRDYETVWRMQQQWVALRAQQEIPDRLILVEHPPVLTAGRKFKPAHLLSPDQTPLYQIERGGDISFHEPGQIVAYPIFYLDPARRNIRAFLSGLENVIIQVLTQLGLNSERDPENTGVWIAERKIASIGIAVRRWVTYHGFALNVNNDLLLTREIQPCGFDGSIMTSLQAEQIEVNLAEVKTGIIEEHLYCPNCGASSQNIFITIWHSLITGIYLESTEAEAKLLSIDRADILNHLMTHQRSYEELLRRYLNLYHTIEGYHEYITASATGREWDPGIRFLSTRVSEFVKSKDPLFAILESFKPLRTEEYEEEVSDE